MKVANYTSDRSIALGSGITIGSLVSGDVTGMMPGPLSVGTINGLAPSWKNPVRVATTTAGTLASSFEAGDTIDGVVLAYRDRILIKNQADPTENGIYVVQTSDEPTRSGDMDQDDEVVGAITYVVLGTVNAGLTYIADNTTDPDIGTDAITFSLFGDAPGGFLTKVEGGQDTIKSHGSLGSTATIDPSDGNVHTGTLNANCTITLNDPTGSGAAVIEVRLLEDGTGGWTPTFAAASGTIRWPGGVTPTHDTTHDTQTRYLFERLSGETVWDGNVVGAGGVTVKDEGTPLATTATALDFVGAGVTASGTGATKTITIPGSTGTVTSVALSVPAEFSVSGSPVTTSGTLAISKATETANTVWAGPTTGSAAQPTFRALVAADIPAGIGSTDHQHVMDVLLSGDGSRTAFELPAAPFDAYSVAAYVSGVLTEVTLSGTMLTTATFGSAPASASNNIRFDIVAAVV